MKLDMHEIPGQSTGCAPLFFCTDEDIGGVQLRRHLPPSLSLLGYLCSDHLSTACTSFDKPTNVHMPLDTAEETALRCIFPQHDIQLSCVVEDVLVVGLGRERGVQEP